MIYIYYVYIICPQIVRGRGSGMSGISSLAQIYFLMYNIPPSFFIRAGNSKKCLSELRYCLQLLISFVLNAAVSSSLTSSCMISSEGRWWKVMLAFLLHWPFNTVLIALQTLQPLVVFHSVFQYCIIFPLDMCRCATCILSHAAPRCPL